MNNELIYPHISNSNSAQLAGNRLYSRFKHLVASGAIPDGKLKTILADAVEADVYPEELLMVVGVPRHEILNCLSVRYHLPVVEFNEDILIPRSLADSPDLGLEGLKKTMWVPVSINENQADVIVVDPENPETDEAIKKILSVGQLNKSVALPADLIRIIEHNQDVNPKFPPSSHRTIQAELRTYLADFRTLMAGHRTSMAKGRTGLAMIRTGLAFKAVILTMINIFGIGYFIIPEMIGIVIGFVFLIHGLRWYLPVRKLAGKRPYYHPTDSTFGSTVLAMKRNGDDVSIDRTDPVEGADTLRLGWHRLSSVMKRRFLATDRTDLAEERTALASFRTSMAQARTGLAFTRTGISFTGLGIGLWRLSTHSNGWIVFYVGLIFVGILMTMEGFYWYVPGRRAANWGLELIRKKRKNISIWDFMFKLFRNQVSAGELPATLFVGESHSPGIWGSTGLALERTLIAERRNVKARLRTIMARSRTGMAIIRTGTKLFVVGMGLLVYFGTVNRPWAVCEILIVIVSLILIVDGFSWHIPAERVKNRLAYCSSDMEIVIPDYSKPAFLWSKVVLNNDES